jgi:uncharacterized protein
MSRTLRRLLFFIVWLGCSLGAMAQGLQPIPDLKARVTDQTGTLSAQDIAGLTEQLATIEQSKGSQVAILIVPTTVPEDIFDYSIRVVEKWKLGRGKVEGKMVGDGVLILVAKNDRKVRIEVGRGLEGAIPDSRAKRIISESITPRFKTGDFAGGLKTGVDDLAKLIGGEPLPEPWKAPKKSPITGTDNSADEGFGGFLPVLMIALVGSLIARVVLGRFLGSIAAGLGTAFLVNLETSLLPVAVICGFVMTLLLMAMGGGVRTAGRLGPRTYGHGPIIMGGGWGGGGFGGGSSGGGGFSGGGGDFGGGGASGDW